MADSVECIETFLNNQQFRLNKINEIKDYFIAEINQQESMNKRFSKYIAFCDYSDKLLVVFFFSLYRYIY